MKSLHKYIAVLCGLFLLPTANWAQAYQANIFGSIRDSSGAVVQGVRVSVVNESTGLIRRAQSDANGNYLVANVPVGSYSISAEAAGFKQRVERGFSVHVAQDARLDLELEIGEVTESVSVTADPPVVQTDESSVSTVISQRSIVGLPLNGRDYTQLAALSPGVVHGGNNGWSSQVSINGNRAGKTEFLIDGAVNSETWYGGALLSPSLDAIAEFRVQASMSPAEYGYGSGFVNAVTKSGTNEYHGTLFHFLRNNAMDARNFFALERPKLIRNQFGATVGGPIKKNSLFFYTDLEVMRERQERVTNTLVPNSALVQGDFSTFPTTIVDPQTGLPFPNNRIPSDRISPIAQYYQGFVPGPNAANDRFIVNTAAPIDQNQFSLRLDNHTDRTMIAARYLHGSNKRENGSGGQIYGSTNPLGNMVQDVVTHNTSLNINHVLRPNLLLNVRGGYYYNHFYQTTPSDDGPLHTVESGIDGFRETTATLRGGFPYVSVTGYGGIPGGLNLDIKPKQEVQTYMAALSWMTGKHSMKFGMQLRRELGTTQHYSLSKGVFNFTGAYTGDPYADYLLGFPNYSNRSFPQDQSGSRIRMFHFYAQDDWQVARNLTINAGLRVEINPFPTPLRSGSNFDIDLGKVVLASKGGVVDFFSQVGPFAYAFQPDLYVLSEDVGAPFSLVNAKGGVFNPRLGFAWRPFGGASTVIRGGAGFFTVPLQQQIGRGGPTVNPPWIITEFKFSPDPIAWGTFWRPITEENGFTPAMVTAMDNPFRNAYSAQWNLTVEQRIARDTSVSVAYVGNKATHLHLNNNLNQPRYGPNSWNEIPFPEFGSFSQALQTRGNSNYHSLQLQAEKKYSQSFTFLTSYSWSKTIDYTSDDTGFVTDRFNIGLDRGISGLDSGHRLVGSFVADLPFGAGRQWLTSGPASHILGGWQITSIGTLQSGQPFSVMSPIDTSGFFVMNGQRADRIGKGVKSNPTLDEWFDTRAFTQGSEYTVGTAGRNILRSDGLVNFDFGLLKNFAIKEWGMLQVRGEAFNAFNHPTFGTPFNTIGQPTSGLVTTAGPGRMMQAGLKLSF